MARSESITSKIQVLTEMTPQKMKNDLHSFLGKLNYLIKFSPVTGDVGRSLHKLTSITTDQPWNRTYQDLYEKANAVVRRNKCMNIYDADRCLYLEINTFGISLGAGLLQVRDSMNCGHGEIPDNAILSPIAFTSKSLSCVQQCYSNIECKVLGILHGIEKFHLYCTVREVGIITDHEPLLAVLSKDVATFLQQLQE